MVGRAPLPADSLHRRVEPVQRAGTWSQYLRMAALTSSEVWLVPPLSFSNCLQRSRIKGIHASFHPSAGVLRGDIGCPEPFARDNAAQLRLGFEVTNRVGGFVKYKQPAATLAYHVARIVLPPLELLDIDACWLIEHKAGGVISLSKARTMALLQRVDVPKSGCRRESQSPIRPNQRWRKPFGRLGEEGQ